MCLCVCFCMYSDAVARVFTRSSDRVATAEELRVTSIYVYSVTASDPIFFLCRFTTLR